MWHSLEMINYAVNYADEPLDHVYGLSWKFSAWTLSYWTEGTLMFTQEALSSNKTLDQTMKSYIKHASIPKKMLETFYIIWFTGLNQPALDLRVNP